MRILKFLIWPIVILGLLKVVSVIVSRQLREKYNAQVVGEDSVNAVAVMDGWEGGSASKSFKGGNVRAIMGGVQLDLSDAEIDWKPATLDMNVVMGGVELKVPQDWNVKVQASQSMGGIEDSRGRGDIPIGTIPDLILDGKVVMGGVSIS